MKVVLIRHGKVNFKWRLWYTSEQFNEACRQYNLAPIQQIEYSIPEGVYSCYYISMLSRTRETAQSIFGERNYIATKLIDEVPLSASYNTWIKMPLMFWNVTGRIQWFFNNSKQKENRLQAEKRANQFVKVVMEKNEDCVVVTHGFFMHMLVSELKKYGFTIDNKSTKYANGDYVVARTS